MESGMVFFLLHLYHTLHSLVLFSSFILSGMTISVRRGGNALFPHSMHLLLAFLSLFYPPYCLALAVCLANRERTRGE